MKYMLTTLVLAVYFGAVPAYHAEGYVNENDPTTWIPVIDGKPVVRPRFGPCTVGTAFFIIHYETIGEHAATRAYAESVAVYAEEAWRVQVDSLGRTPPPPDRGRGGDDRYDIYIRNTTMTVCVPESSSPGPEYPDAYTYTCTSYIVVRSGILNSFGGNWRILREVVADVFDAASRLAMMRYQRDSTGRCDGQ